MNACITLIEDGERISVVSPYSPILVERFRSINGRLFNGESKAWTFPATREALSAVCDVAGVVPWMLPNDLQAIFRDAGEQVVPSSKPVDMTLIEGHVFNTKPFEHQRTGLARLMAERRWLDASSMGVGKSAIICNRLKAFGKTPLTLILCPKSVCDGWVEQLAIHAGLTGVVVRGTTDKREKILRSGDRIFIANYELLLHSDLSRFAWEVIAFDEVHRLKGFTTQTAKVARSLSANASHVWGLSGTPAPNGLEDWLGVLSAIDPQLLPTKTKVAFEARYCVKREIQKNVWKVAGYQNVAELHGYIASITSRVVKEDVIDLPPKTFLPRTVSLEGEQARVYRELKKDAVSRLVSLKSEGQLTIRNVLTESLRLLQVVGGFMPTDDGEHIEMASKAKLSAMEDCIEAIGERQAVIWCAFRPEVAMIVRWLEKTHGMTASTLTGELTGKERSESIDAFRRRQTQFFVGTAAAGGTGINGLTGADTCIYYSRNFSLTDYLQSQDRCHRIGTTSPVTIVKLIASGTIDEKVDAALDHKRDMLEMLLKDPREML